MRREKILLNRESYTASPASQKVNVTNLDRLEFGIDFLEAGATPPTLAQLIAHTTDIKLTVGGEIETLVRIDDLYALNYILYGHKPFYLLPTADNEIGMLNDLWLPVELTTDLSMTVDLTYAGHATIDTEKIVLVAKHRDKPYPHRPLSLTYVTVATATSLKEIDFEKSGRSLEGLLIFNTTIPTVSAYDATVGELKILLKRKEIYHTHFNTMKGILNHDVEDTAIGAILDNYAYCDFRDDPIPADDLKLAIKSISSATDNARLIGLFR